MKKKILQLGAILLLTICVVGVFGPITQAVAATTQGDAAGGSVTPETGITTFFGKNLDEFFGTIVAQIANWAIVGMGFVLTLSGKLLNFSVNLTLHIKDFVNSAPAIYTTWKAIRDISGLFIIFALLFAAIQLILGLKGASFGHLIKNVVVVGILINFSFFFAAVGIDASNIVSVQLYNAIAPANSLNVAAATSGVSAESFGLNDGGLSDIFMTKLKIPSLYKTQVSAGQAAAAQTGGGAPSTVVILVAGIVAVIIELAAALSFAAAAFAFIMRFVVLLILLAFSPIWIASYVVPQLHPYSKQWTQQYTAMLTFMPVYLLLMYLALNVLTSSNLFGAINSSGVVGNGAWYGGLLALGVNAFLVCFLLNMPLIVAAKMGGIASEFINPKKIGMDTLFKKFSSQTGSRTVGRMAYAAGNSNTVKSFVAARPALGGLLAGGLSKVGNVGFGQKKGGYEDRLKAKSSAEEKLHKKLGTIDESKYDNKTPDKEGKTALDRAKGKAKEFQSRYRSNLSWEAKPSNLYLGKIPGFLLDNRANRQTARKLENETKKKQSVKEESELKKQKNDLTDKLTALKARLEKESKPIGLMPGKVPSASELKEQKEMEDKIVEIDKKLEEIEEIKEDARLDKLADGVAKKSKEGGGGEKEEKKEEKKDDH
jgi:hypothetical protein